MKIKLENQKIFESFFTYSFLFVVILVLVLTIKGLAGNPSITDLRSPLWSSKDGPLELSPDRGRYALLYSIVEYGTVTFPVDVARFALPDLGYFNGKYVSLFAPGMSFIIIPGYILGKALGISQVGAFSVITLIAFLNVLLIRAIALKQGLSIPAANLGALAFIFGTVAFPYSVSLYQHHIAAFFVLLSLYVLMIWKDYRSLLVVWFLCAVSISVDYPNLFLMFPLGVYALGYIISIEKVKDAFTLKFKPLYLLTFITVIPALMFFFWFNKESYGSPTQLAGTVVQIQEIDANDNPITLESKKNEGLSKVVVTQSNSESRGALGFFQTRRMLEGFYILFASPDRGLVMYAPVMLFSLLGFYILLKEKNPYLALITSIIAVNFVLYAMWGDVWGGWAFGSRYSIPAYALMSVLISFVLNRYGSNIFFCILFTSVLGFSTYINTIGALTSNSIPPKVEVLKLEELSGHEEKYTYERNIPILNSNNARSFAFNSYFKNIMTAWQFFYLIFYSILSLQILNILLLFVSLRIKRYA